MIGKRVYINEIKNDYIILAVGEIHQPQNSHTIYITASYEPLEKDDIVVPPAVMYYEFEELIRKLLGPNDHTRATEEEFYTLFRAKSFFDVSWSYEEEVHFFDSKINAIDVLYKEYK